MHLQHLLRHAKRNFLCIPAVPLHFWWKITLCQEAAKSLEQGKTFPVSLQSPMKAVGGQSLFKTNVIFFPPSSLVFSICSNLQFVEAQSVFPQGIWKLCYIYGYLSQSIKGWAPIHFFQIIFFLSAYSANHACSTKVSRSHKFYGWKDLIKSLHLMFKSNTVKNFVVPPFNTTT